MDKEHADDNLFSARDPYEQDNNVDSGRGESKLLANQGRNSTLQDQKPI
jgi:hypothetical protein